MTGHLTAEWADRFAGIALRNVAREYPNNLDHALSCPDDARTPRDLHPIFFGSFDWHSCVHNHWLLAHVLRRFPDIPRAAAIRDWFDARFTHDAVAAECAYFEAPTARAFKRPYGWAWLLKLAAELQAHDPPWAETLSPLSSLIARRFADFLPVATYPVRVGTHFNTAFALRLSADYADAVGDESFGVLIRSTARRWYGADRDCSAWGEPSLDEFLSPTLMEAECMRRLLPPGSFLNWFSGFLPDIASRVPNTLFRPPSVSDRTDGKIAHLDGLSLSRAWCFRALASALDAADPRRAALEEAGAAHLAAGLPHITGDYAGEHWLASFAVLALEAWA